MVHFPSIARNLTLGILTFLSFEAFALPFTIVPREGSSLPTTVNEGETATALYSVTNNTASIRAGNYVKYLPPNVRQVTSDASYPDLCGATFTLVPGGSCTLELSVSGAVNAQDPNPHHHLFVCFPGGVTCAGTLFPLNVSQIPVPPNNTLALVTAGFYSVAGQQLPLIANSTDGGLTWVYRVTSTSPTLPAGTIGKAIVVSSSCSGNNCISSGSYQTAAIVSQPLIAQSSDAGITWTYSLDTSNTPLPGDWVAGNLDRASSCSGQNCIAVGSYFSTLAARYPLLAHSSNGGANWSYRIDSSTSAALPSDFSGSGVFNSASCSGLICSAAGEYNSQYIMLASSNDGGLTWVNRIDSSNLPPSFSFGSFNSTSCSGTNCIAAGTYSDGSISAPLVASSFNGGLTWSYTITATTPTLPALTQNAFFTSASCSGLICVVAGVFSDASFMQRPFLANSTDGGATWAYRISDIGPVLPNFDEGEFSSCSCSGQNCVAAGSYTTTLSADTSVMLANSTDGGLSWTYSISATSPALPADSIGDSSFRSASCSGLHCIASGSYTTASGVRPLLANSVDGGVSWEYRIDNNQPAFPDPSAFIGILTSTASSSQAAFLNKLTHSNYF